jgi:hypothetical protein
VRSSLLAVAALVPLFPVPAPLFAQVLEDNIWGWHDHQPTEAWVRQNEEAAGVAASQSQTKAEHPALARASQIINPKTARSQAIAGIISAIGQALLKQSETHPMTGRLLNRPQSRVLAQVQRD